MLAARTTFSIDDWVTPVLTHPSINANVAVIGALIRTVRSLQLFSRDGSFSETTSTYLRGSSVGTWSRGDEDGSYVSTYWFFRYNPDGSLKSIAEALDSASLSPDGKTFTSKGTITDVDAAATCSPSAVSPIRQRAWTDPADKSASPPLLTRAGEITPARHAASCKSPLIASNLSPRRDP